MKCETCQGRGFIEYEHGLVMVGCEVCNGTGEVEETVGETLVEVAAEANAYANALMPRLEGEISIGEVVELKEGEERLDVVAELTSEGTERLKEIGIINVSSDGTESDNQPIGSTDTSKPKRTRKSKAQKKARKGTS